ncbi:hypothetical protein AMAG_20785 [Allomyces macrogynus ATCC 38327]|uniref:Uncharacterized protein n=1 Tax=Allomyces macrogynus (strain ATCC 38327) TaxID=578462 RepID=A0A0L0TFF8_ALLM3|nr:hypothetical protein AMAG_20785 [Allomyces macrogynus ATCC 38327]|eukprot:KNE73440.1 hypothetical protein AMAG_20785 [Allomyces macrogynus ATCC 38327]
MSDAEYFRLLRGRVNSRAREELARALGQVQKAGDMREHLTRQEIVQALLEAHSIGHTTGLDDPMDIDLAALKPQQTYHNYIGNQCTRFGSPRQQSDRRPSSNFDRNNIVDSYGCLYHMTTSHSNLQFLSQGGYPRHGRYDGYPADLLTRIKSRGKKVEVATAGIEDGVYKVADNQAQLRAKIDCGAGANFLNSSILKRTGECKTVDVQVDCVLADGQTRALTKGVWLDVQVGKFISREIFYLLNGADFQAILGMT